MFVGGRPGRARGRWPRGVPGDRPGGDSLGGLAKWAAEPRTRRRGRDARWPEATRQALGGRPGPVLPVAARGPPRRADARRRPGRRRAGRASPRDRRARSARSSSFLRLGRARRSSSPVAGILRARTSTELTRFAELLQVPVIAAMAPRGRHLERPSARTSGWPALAPPRRSASGSTAPTPLLVIGSRLNEATTYGYDDAATRPAPGRTSTSCPGALRRVTDARDRGRGRRQGVPQGGQRAAARSRRARRAPRRGDVRPHNRADRAAFEAASVVDDAAVGRPGRPSGPTDHDPAPGPARRRDPDHRCRQFRAAGSAAASGSAGPGRSSAPRRARWATACRRPSPRALVHRDRPVVALVGDGGLAMTMAELETAVRVGARVVVVVFDNERYGTIRMWQEEREPGVGVATELGPVDFGGHRARLWRARRAGRARRRLRARLAGGARGRIARRSSRSRSTGRGCRSIIRPADAADLPPRARTTVWAARGSGSAPYAAASLASRGVHPLHGWRRRARRDVRSPLRGRSRGRSWR